MKHRILSALLAAAMCFSASATAVQALGTGVTDADVLSGQTAKASYDEASVYNAMIALEDEYPDGMEWTNDNFYVWNGGGSYTGGYGCVAFAFILSDAAFGNLPSRQINAFNPSDIRVGDIIRYSGHSIIVLEVHEDYFIVAEGNINSSVMWGRDVSFGEIEGGFEHYLTRYPMDEEEPSEPITTEPISTETTEATETAGIYEVEFWMEVTPPYKVDYYIGEELDLTGLEANVCCITYYMNGLSEYSTFSVPAEDLEVYGYSGGLGLEGTNILYVVYEGDVPNVGMARMESSFIVTITAQTTQTTTTETTAEETTTTETTTVITETTESTETTERSLTEIAFGLERISCPDKMTYALGEEFDLTGLVVNGVIRKTYSDNTVETEVVIENIDHDLLEVTGFDSSAYGTCTVLISYDYLCGAAILNGSTAFPVEIAEPYDDTTGGSLGDADLNGIVDATDAGELLAAAAIIGAGGDSGLNAEQTANADVDGNGVLDAVDAAWILRYSAYTGTGGMMTMEQFFAEHSV